MCSPPVLAALTAAADSGEVLMEHVYPAKPEALPLMKQTLTVGLEVKLERTHDVSAVIHAERLIDGRILVTTVPLLYGSYTVTRGLGTFRLEPPPTLNLVAGWPLFKSQERASIEQRLAEYRQKMAAAQAGPIPIPGLGGSATPPPAKNELVRIEQARPVAPLAMTPPGVASNEKLAKSTPVPKGKKGIKQKLESPGAERKKGHETKARISGAGSDSLAGSGRSKQIRASWYTHHGCVRPCSSERVKPSCRHSSASV